MTRAVRDCRKLLDTIAMNNEDAAIAVMKAAERIGDAHLKQQLLEIIQRMHQDAADLRTLRQRIDQRA